MSAPGPGGQQPGVVEDGLEEGERRLLISRACREEGSQALVGAANETAGGG